MSTHDPAFPPAHDSNAGDAKTAEPISRLQIHEIETPEVSSALYALVNDCGDLVLEGFDAGPRLREFTGEEEYEYCLTVSRAYRDTVFLHLIKDRFDSAHKFRNWLSTKAIPSNWESWQ